MVDKTTPRLGLPVPFLTNPLKIDVGKLTEALTMLDANAVMLTDWDITADGWQKMGTITDLAQGKIALTLMVITGTGFANIVMQTGDGSVTTVGDPARISVTAQTNLGPNEPTILGGKIVETAQDSYEVWFNIAPSTAPRKWSALLAAGNGAKIDWTHTVGAQPAGGVTILVARSLTDQEIASPTITRNGAVLTAGYAGLMGINLPYYDFAASGDKITDRIWRVGETIRVKKDDATAANGFPPEIPVLGASFRIHCDGINENRTMWYFTFTTEGVAPTTVYRIGRTNTAWTTPPTRLYSSEKPPTAAEVKAVPTLTEPVNTVINLNDRIMPAHYGVMSITNVAGAVAANNYPYDELGQLFVFPFGKAGGVTQLYVTVSGRIAARNYDGSVFTTWRKTANSGANDDITSLTALSGSLKLGGDAVNDYDAVTLRQLKATTGSGGPTMNGVANNFIGAVEWWNGSRAKLPAGYIQADGQLLKRADYPEIWAAIKAGILNSVSDTLWRGNKVSNPDGFGYHRAKYSLGYKADGATDGTLTDGETFRMPDLNGVKVDGVNSWTYGTSSPALHLRGDTFGVDGTTEAGTVSRNAAPNITGRITTARSSQSDIGPILTGQGDAFYASGALSTIEKNLSSLPSVTVAARGSWTTFDASLSAASYGRDNTTEVRPNSAIGIWLIRVSGSFQAANTTFEVITGDTVVPSNNTVVYGGAIKSVYQVAGKEYMRAQMVMRKTIGGTGQINLSFTDSSSGTPVDTVFRFNADGKDRTFSGGAFQPLDLNLIIPSDQSNGLVMAAPRDYRGITSYDLPEAYPLGVTGGITKGDSGFGYQTGDILGMIHNRGWADKSGHSTTFQIAYHGNTGRIGYRGASYNTLQNAWFLSQFYEFKTTRNTTIDASGFVKAASPVVNIFGDGKHTVNEEAKGVTITRKGEGEYLIVGCMGLHSDAAWGGPDGGFSVPKDRNDQPLVWLDYKVNADGSIMVKTYHRTHMDAPEFARNIVAGKNDGDPIDIPKGLFVQARVNMP